MLPVGRRERPDSLNSCTFKRETAECGNLYVVVTWDEYGPYEIFAYLGKVGDCNYCQLEALTRAVSAGLRYGVPAETLIKQLSNIKCPKPLNFPRDKAMSSCPDAIAQCLRNYIVMSRQVVAAVEVS